MEPERKIEIIEKEYWTCNHPKHRHGTKEVAERCVSADEKSIRRREKVRLKIQDGRTTAQTTFQNESIRIRMTLQYISGESFEDIALQWEKSVSVIRNDILSVLAKSGITTWSVGWVELKTQPSKASAECGTDQLIESIMAYKERIENRLHANLSVHVNSPIPDSAFHKFIGSLGEIGRDKIDWNVLLEKYCRLNRDGRKRVPVFERDEDIQSLGSIEVENSHSLYFAIAFQKRLAEHQARQLAALDYSQIT